MAFYSQIYLLSKKNSSLAAKLITLVKLYVDCWVLARFSPTGKHRMDSGLINFRSSYCPSGSIVAVIGIIKLSVFVIILNSSSIFYVRFTSYFNIPAPPPGLLVYSAFFSYSPIPSIRLDSFLNYRSGSFPLWVSKGAFSSIMTVSFNPGAIGPFLIFHILMYF